MSVEVNIASIKRGFDEMWNQGRVELAEELATPNVVDHHGRSERKGIDALKESVAGLRTSFPDMHFTLEDVIGVDDKVVVRWTFNGTHKGDFMGVTATNKQVTATGIAIARFEDGKCAENWLEWDALGMMQQLGAVPTGRAEA